MPVLQTPPTHWQLGKSFDLREGELSNTPVHRCKLRMNGKEYPNCAVFEDDNYFLVLEIEENCGKVWRRLMMVGCCVAELQVHG